MSKATQRTKPNDLAPSAQLIGRRRELRAVTELLDGIGERGAALVVRGEAGIGKSSLVAAGSEEARARGFQVLTTAGVQSETNLPFAGLHQLLLSARPQKRARLRLSSASEPGAESGLTGCINC